jgi:hypothetical protein
MAEFDWTNFHVSGHAGIDEHWLDGEVDDEMDLEPVLTPSTASTGHAATGTPAIGVAAIQPAPTPPTNTTAPAA